MCQFKKMVVIAVMPYEIVHKKTIDRVQVREPPPGSPELQLGLYYSAIPVQQGLRNC
jgi:hypothetical protein